MLGNHLFCLLCEEEGDLLFRFFVCQGHSLSDGLDDVQRAEMKAYMELVNNMLLTAEVQNTHTPEC